MSKKDTDRGLKKGQRFKEQRLKELNNSYISRICPICRVAVMYPHPESHKREFLGIEKCFGCGYARKNDKS
jgi:hypothetical protein